MIRLFSLRRMIADLSIPRKLALIVGLFCTVVLGLLALGFFGMTILSGSRAYVQGEALYSKAQKIAIDRLTRYALLHDAADYNEYVKAISIPLGDHQARIELYKPHVNQEAAAQGFILGRNHPADVGILIWMAMYLHNFHYMKEALNIWGEADDAIAALVQVADQIHKEIVAGHPGQARIAALLNQVQAIDGKITPLEDSFSLTLGEGARWLKRVLFIVMGVATVLLLVIALFISYRVSHYLIAEIDQLRAGAARIAGGDYSIALDIHSKDEVGELARSFQKMAEQRQEAERIKDEFFANVSHELRTPLTLILSPMESILAGDYGTLDAGAGTALKTMHNNTTRLLQLVNGLLDFSKLEAGKIAVQRSPCAIAELTGTACRDFQPLFKEKNIAIECSVDPKQITVMIDRYLYERILFNLLSNAVKFTPSGGKIRVQLSCADDRLNLSVADTGVGIPAAEQGRIFKRFHQVEGSSTRRYEGTGLGLALVKEFAGLLKGEVSVTSTVGKGSTFSVSCLAPVTQAQAQALEPSRRHVPQYSAQANGATSPAQAGASKSKVLIAEDNPELAAYIETLLAPYAQVQRVSNGKEALARARAWQPDLLLTDVMMPEYDGLSLCRDIKADPLTATLPVVMLTALTHREALLEGWKAGADEYLFKPFHPKELITRICAILNSRQQQKQADEKIAALNKNLQRHVVEVDETNKELEAFSYSVSHDLRAPLRAIDGFSKELMDNCSAFLNEQGKADLARIRAAVKRMSQLIDDLLELSRLSRKSLTREPMNLSRLVTDLMQKFQSEQGDRSVECAVAPNMAVDADSHLLQIACTNLIQNSFKFTQHQEHPRIEFNVLDKDGEKVYFIRDNGAGFNMDYAGQLFKPFQRLHNVSDYPGTGIGLTLVQRIIQRHGGKIWAEAQEGRGATFYFTLG